MTNSAEQLPNENSRDPGRGATQSYGDYAGFATRLVAFVIDVALVMVVSGFVALFGHLLGNFLLLRGMTLHIFQFGVKAAAFGINIGYFVLFWSLAGYTPGKRILGLIVVRVDGGRVSVRMALIRYLGYYRCSEKDS